MESTSLPKKYQSLYRKDPKGKDLGVDETTLTEIPPDKVLVKMAYAPINPSDLMFFIKNNYGDPSQMPKGPVICGFEGSGTIEAVGSNNPSTMIGTKVSMFLSPSATEFWGTWSEYVVTEPKNLILFPDEAQLENIHSPFINPLTAFAMLQTLIEDKADSVIFNAGASQVCRMATRLCKEKNINVLTIVRRDQHIEEMLGEGSHTVLNCKSSTYLSDLQKAVDQLKPVHFFDAVAGTEAVKIWEQMPSHATLFNYGALSMKPFDGINPFETIFKRKTIRCSFLLYTYIIISYHY